MTILCIAIACLFLGYTLDQASQAFRPRKRSYIQRRADSAADFRQYVNYRRKP